MIRNKKGDLDIDSLVKIVIALIILGISIAAVVLLKDKGGSILSTLKSFFSFGI